MARRTDICFEAEEAVEDGVSWVDLVWRNWRLEKGHCMDDGVWCLLFNGKHVTFVQSVREARGEIMRFLGESSVKEEARWESR